VVGLLFGEFLDFVLGYSLGMWKYNFLPYWTPIYWAVLPGMWFEFGIGVYIAWIFVTPKILIVPMLGIPYELYGILRQSWTYSEPWFIVAVGWIPLIFTIIWITGKLSKKYADTKIFG
jgi:hypothetical protein